MRHWIESNAVPGSGRAVADGCTEANAFYEPAMLDAALAHYDPHCTVHMIDAMGDDGVALARLPVARSLRHGRFPVAHTVNWTYAHCYYGAPLLREGREIEGWQGILRQLDRASWSGDFLHLRLVDANGPAATSLRDLCQADGRDMREVGRYERAFLHSPQSADAYWTENVRAKKRKELRRQQNRLAECGEIVRHALTDETQLGNWCDAFLTLEKMGWKGEEGTALADRPEDERFFRQACADAFAADALDMLRIDCDGRALAMLVNFVGPKGGFSFKIAIDPAFSRYSPGVLVEMDNLARVLDDRRAPWMDSCAAPDHPMIDSLWAERRVIAQYRIALRKPGLAGLKGRLSRFAISTTEAIARRARARTSP